MIKITVMKYMRDTFDTIKDGGKAVKAAAGTAIGTGAILYALSGQPAEANSQEPDPVNEEVKQEEVVEEDYMEDIGADLDINISRVSTDMDLDTSGFMHRYVESFEDEPLDLDYSPEEPGLEILVSLSAEVYESETDNGNLSAGVYGEFGPNTSYTAEDSRNIRDIEMGFPEKMDAYVNTETDVDVSNVTLGAELSYKPDEDNDSLLHKLSMRAGANRKSVDIDEKQITEFYDSELSAEENTSLSGSGWGYKLSGQAKATLMDDLGENDQGSVYAVLGAAHSGQTVPVDGSVNRVIDSYGTERELEEDYDTEADMSQTEIRFGIGGSF